MADLSALVVRLEAEISSFTSGINKATDQLQKFAADTQKAVDIAKTAFAAFGAVISVDEILQFTEGVIKSNAELINLSASTGIAVAELSQLTQAAQIQGVDNMAQVFQRLEKSIAAAQASSGPARSAFFALGVTVNDLNAAGGDTYKVLQLLANGFAAHADGATKSAAATTLLGRGTQDVISLLDQGAAGIQAYQQEIDQLGGTVMPQLAAQSKELSDNISKLGVAIKGVANDALGQILPDLIAFTGSLDDVAKAEVQAHAEADALVAAFRALEVWISTIAGAWKILHDIKPAAIAQGIAIGLGDRDLAAAKDANAKLVDDVTSTIDTLQKEWGGYAKFVADNNAALAAQTSAVPAVRAGAAAGAELFDESTRRGLTDLSGQTLPGLQPNTKVFADTHAALAGFKTDSMDAAKSSSAAFDSAFGSIATASHATFAGMKTDLDGFASAVEEQAHKNAALAGAPGAALPQVEAIDPAAVKSLESFRQQLEEQVATFNKGALAAEHYSVYQGKVADEIKRAGSEATKAVAGHESLAAAIYRLDAARQAQGVGQHVKRIGDLIAATQDQINTFDKGAIAAEEYAVANGKLAEQLGLTGKAQANLTARVLETNLELNVLKDNDAIQKLGIQALTATGQIEAAQKAAFELANVKLRSDLTIAATAPLPAPGIKGVDYAAAQARRDQAAADLVQLDNSKAINTAQAAYNQLVADATKLQVAFDSQVKDVQAAVTAGQSTELDGANQISELRKQEQEQLDAILDRMKAIPGAMDIPALVEGMTKFHDSIVGLNTEIDTLAKTMRDDLVSDATSAFTAFETGAESGRKAIAQFTKDIENQILSLVNKKLFEGLFSADNVGGATGFIQDLGAKVFGGPSSVGRSIASADYGAQSSELIEQQFGKVAPLTADQLGLGGGAAAAAQSTQATGITTALSTGSTTLSTAIDTSLSTGSTTLASAITEALTTGGATAAQEIAAAMQAGGGVSSATGGGLGASGLASLFGGTGAGTAGVSAADYAGAYSELDASTAADLALFAAATGGSIPVGRETLVGEKGPELFVADAGMSARPRRSRSWQSRCQGTLRASRRQRRPLLMPRRRKRGSSRRRRASRSLLRCRCSLRRYR